VGPLLKRSSCGDAGSGGGSARLHDGSPQSAIPAVGGPAAIGRERSLVVAVLRVGCPASAEFQTL
jgi:hypothetical protein